MLFYLQIVPSCFGDRMIVPVAEDTARNHEGLTRDLPCGKAEQLTTALIKLEELVYSNDRRFGEPARLAAAADTG
jgi:hypothetical protein